MILRLLQRGHRTALSAVFALLASGVSAVAAADGTPGITGVYTGEHMLTMRGCPGVCSATSAIVLGTGVKTAAWTWNFDEGWAEIEGTTLTVGFVYEVQDLFNADPDGNRVYFDDNGDGTYTLSHGFQIYNPNVGNPRTETTTRFRITQSGNQLTLVTIDDEPNGALDGVAGTQIVGVFPMTVQPDFAGTARLEGSSSGGDGISDADKLALGLNPDALNADTDGDGIADVDELGDDLSAPLDSDGDGVIDALEPGDAALDATRVAGLALVGGIPGVERVDNVLSAQTVALSVNSAWRFTAAETGNMALESGSDGTEVPEISLGDSGLDYRYGYTGFTVVSAQQAASDAVTIRLSYSVALPDKLVLYALSRDTGRGERYTLLDESAWSRVDGSTVDVTLALSGDWNVARQDGVLKSGVAPVENTLGGYDEESGNGGGAWPLGLLLGLGLLAVSRRAAHRRR